MLKTQVKVSSITNLSDARYCAGMGVDLLGFPIQEISLEKFTEILKQILAINKKNSLKKNCFFRLFHRINKEP